jgi:CBS domain-containing protein
MRGIDHRLALRNEKPMPNCSQLMTHHPVFCLASDTVDRAAQLMRQEDVGSLPVIENHQSKKLLGIVTDRDIALQVVADARDARRTRVQEVMTRNPVTCHADNDLQVALAAMAGHQVRRIPIVDEEDQILGIISQSDIATRVSEPGRTAELVREISKSGRKSSAAGPLP